MTPAALEAWLVRLNFNRSEGAAALGISRNTLQNYLEGKSAITRTVALACSAIAFGLPEYPEPEGGKND